MLPSWENPGWEILKTPGQQSTPNSSLRLISLHQNNNENKNKPNK